MPKYNITKVSGITLKIGAMRLVVPDALRFGFELLSQDTPLDGAEIIIEDEPTTGRCKNCGMSFLWMIGLILILFFEAIFLSSCVIIKHMSVEVDIKGNSPPVFRFGGYKDPGKPAYIRSLRVFSEYPDERSEKWAIRNDKWTTPLHEVVYGVVPDGFHLYSGADTIPLEPGAEYLLDVHGSGLDNGSTLTHKLYFIYKPGVTRLNLSEIIYAKVDIKENSPPIFKVSYDEKFQMPAPIRKIWIRAVDWEGRKYWTISRDNNEPGPVWLREITYGVVPDGFRESSKAEPLKPGAQYSFNIVGGSIRYVDMGIYFINKPGEYPAHKY